MGKFKITFTDFVLAMTDIAIMLIRPTVIYLVWNFLIANATCPKITFLQVISGILIFKFLVTYIPQPEKE